MKYGINLHPTIPVRSQADEGSEMTTQLLFGEIVQICEEIPRWCSIINQRDGDEGWIDSKTITVICESEFEQLSKSAIYFVSANPAKVLIEDNSSIMWLTAGSIIPNYNPATSSALIHGRHYHFQPSDLITQLPINYDNLIQITHSYLNAPYLWGGKNLLGIDCSGLVQIVYALFGINLKRNAKDQAVSGINIDFISDAKCGDLAYFSNPEGKITHVGILLSPNHIIHASGWVKIDQIDSYGIYSHDFDKYTHQLSHIKRVIPDNLI